jgi:hypothetical protein
VGSNPSANILFFESDASSSFYGIQEEITVGNDSPTYEWMNEITPSIGDIFKFNMPPDEYEYIE